MCSLLPVIYTSFTIFFFAFIRCTGEYGIIKRDSFIFQSRLYYLRKEDHYEKDHLSAAGALSAGILPACRLYVDRTASKRYRIR